jgi:hypothetical protein
MEFKQQWKKRCVSNIEARQIAVSDADIAAVNKTIIKGHERVIKALEARCGRMSSALEDIFTGLNRLQSSLFAKSKMLSGALSQITGGKDEYRCGKSHSVSLSTYSLNGLQAASAHLHHAVETEVVMDKEWKKFLQMEVRRLPQRTPQEKAARKHFATQCGHVSRRLYRDERLEGELLELAVSACFEDATAEKLRKGEPLTDYEKHLVVDVALLHMRLG